MKIRKYPILFVLFFLGVSGCVTVNVDSKDLMRTRADILVDAQDRMPEILCDNENYKSCIGYQEKNICISGLKNIGVECSQKLLAAGAANELLDKEGTVDELKYFTACMAHKHLKLNSYKRRSNDFCEMFVVVSENSHITIR